MNQILILFFTSSLVLFSLFIFYLLEQTIQQDNFPDKNEYLPFKNNSEGYTSLNSNYDSRLNYDSNKYDVVYHDSISDLSAQGGLGATNLNTYHVLDSSGNKVDVPYYGNKNPTFPIYNQPRSFVYGSQTYIPSYADSIYLSNTPGKISSYKKESYVPNYEDTVYSSKTTREQSTRKLSPDYSSEGGFCKENNHSIIELEEKCSQLSREQCSDSPCCVLLGGSKCVAGNENGRYKIDNYTVPYTRDTNYYYYYQGNCYGNCIEQDNYGETYDENNTDNNKMNYNANDSNIYDNTNDDDNIDGKETETKWKTYSTPDEINMTSVAKKYVNDIKKDYEIISPNNAFAEEILNPYNKYGGWKGGSLLDLDLNVSTLK